MTLPLAVEINAFHVVGGLLTLWALVVSALGITVRGFPRGAGAERAVMGLTALLVVGAVGTAIGTSASENEHAEEPGRSENRLGGQGSPEPEEGQGGSPAPRSGSGEDSQSGAEAPKPQTGAQTIENPADPQQLAFQKDALQAKPGIVTLDMPNPSSVPHNIALEGQGVDRQGKVVNKGGTSTVQAEGKAGEYTFYCSVPGHREGGMQGTLTVK